MSGDCCRDDIVKAPLAATIVESGHERTEHDLEVLESFVSDGQHCEDRQIVLSSNDQFVIQNDS